MPRIDAHQHFWQYNAVRDSWITEEMAVIRRDFLPEDLRPLLQQNDFDGCVVVQSDQSELENEFHLMNSDQYDFIRGIVGWVDLQARNIEERLDYYSSFKMMKGFRHVLQGEPDRALMLKPAFKNGIKKLRKYGFTYDLLIYPDQLEYAAELVAAYPDQKFVIDHIAKPNIKANEITDWENNMRVLGNLDNLYCKISGMVTEADWKYHKPEDFAPYMDVVVQSFGINRIMFGSDWPVCLVAASYEEVIEIVTSYFAAFSEDERERFFGLNATRFYNL